MDTEENKDTQGLDIYGKIGALISFIFIWLVLGGFFTIGPFISHNIESTVGKFFLYAPAITWLVLPVTFLISVSRPNKISKPIFVVNLCFWLVLLAALYIRWN